MVDVLSETGGREVPIYYGLTAREAWTIAMFRHDMATVDRLKDAISDRAAAKRCRRTIIGAKAVVTGAGYIDSMDIMAAPKSTARHGSSTALWAKAQRPDAA